LKNLKENAEANLKNKKNFKSVTEGKTIAKKTIFEKKDKAVTLYLVEDDTRDSNEMKEGELINLFDSNVKE
jgi:hypothetical protein